MFNFHVNPDFDILFEKLTAEIGDQLSLETQLRFDALGNL